jgi:hypothetical protein
MSAWTVTRYEVSSGDVPDATVCESCCNADRVWTVEIPVEDSEWSDFFYMCSSCLPSTVKAYGSGS